MDICQIGYDIREFDSLRGLGIDIICRVHFDNRDRFAIWMGNIGKATKPYQQMSGCWHLTFDSFLNRSRPNWITGPGPKLEPAGKSESRGPENGVSRWWRPNSDNYSQNHHFGIVYDMIHQFLGMEAKNYQFGMFCQQCHPSVAPGDADIRPRNASRIHTCHLFTS